MKKSLSVILSSAMALSVFSSIAFADTAATTTTAAKKTSADFTDLKDLDAATKAKFDAMISAGIFEGTTDTTFGLKEEMNRAQFAKVAALILGVDINKDLKTSSFSDVKADDAANGYALPYIEALKTAGVTDGYGEGTYNPAGKVTKEQLATFLVRVLGKDADAKAKTGNDTTVTDWAQGYVALALELKLLPTGDGGKFQGQANATRDLLLTGAYEAKQQYVPAGKVSVTGAKAAGVQKVEVSFNKPVDTTKATLELKKGSSSIATKATWSDDKKTATLALTDEKLRAGDYSVAVSGLDAATVDKTTATFTAQDEVLQKIDFVSASDTIAYSTSTVVKAKATNQYGENASFNAGSYTVYPGGASFTKINKQDDGTLAITLDTTNGGSNTQGVSIVSVSIVNNDQHVTASKNFKLGTVPILSKLELGNAQYSNSSNAITGKGDTVKFDLNLYDQYGGNISYDSPSFNKSDINVIWNEYIGTNSSNQDVITKDVEDNGSNIPRLKLSLNDNVDKSGDYTFTVMDQAATATGKVSIKSVAVATKVEIGDFNDVIAAGDHDVYIPVTAYDASGTQLSLDDLTSDTNRKRININVSGANYETLITDSGAHRGSVHLKNITGTSKGSVSLTAVIATPNATSTATKTWTVSDVRIPDRIKEVAKPAKEIVAGAKSSFQYQILDQYGKVMDYNLDTVGTNGNGSVGTSVTYDVYVGLKNADAGAFVLTRDDSSEVKANNVVADETTYTTFTSSDETDAKAFKQFNKGLRLTAKAGSQGKKATLRIAIRKNTQELTYIEQQVTVAPNANSTTGEDWTYSLNGPDKLYNTMDSGVLDSASASIQSGTGTNVSNNSLAQRINFSVKNASGDVVTIPDNFITSVTSSNQVAVRVGQTTSGKWYALGNKTGTATVTATYVNNKGETKQASKTITVVGDAPTITNLIADSKVTVSGSTAAETVYYAAADYVALGQSSTVAGTAPYNSFTPGVTPIEVTEGLTNLHIYDSYNVELDGFDVNDYNFVYGLSFTIQHVNATAGNASNVTIDSNNQVHIAAGFKGTFDLVVTAPSGKSTSTEVTVK
ncbi:S-layer homology domain-containing protein [Paenibacillus frigoriresistens]|uniref:S-layer homology domain-containing protein n=1 Tax=Paenibacillus alginolyticus TaxID=59839 RepID=UPI0015676B16|nr:S-layer homology domain-containing protein [Paenibacillus frigoriresistens]NRF93629.1 S-layer homology domain-containing protein [Paenibacillus frigoriresistens]